MHVARDLSPQVCVIRELFVLGHEISFSYGFSNNNWFKTTIKFTTEISDTEITSWIHAYVRAKFSPCVGTSNRQILSNIHTSPPATFQASGKALPKENQLFKSYIWKKKKNNNTQFKRWLRDRGYRDNILENTLSGIKFNERKSALQNKQKNVQKNFAVCYRVSPICA